MKKDVVLLEVADDNLRLHAADIPDSTSLICNGQQISAVWAQSDYICLMRQSRNLLAILGPANYDFATAETERYKPIGSVVVPSSVEFVTVWGLPFIDFSDVRQCQSGNGDVAQLIKAFGREVVLTTDGHRFFDGFERLESLANPPAEATTIGFSDK
jgi:hypothetical protein